MLTRHSERELFFLGTTHLTPPEASRRTSRVLEHREPKERWEDPGYPHAFCFLFFCQKTFLSQMTLTHTPIGWEDPSSSASIGGAILSPTEPPHAQHSILRLAECAREFACFTAVKLGSVET